MTHAFPDDECLMLFNDPRYHHLNLARGQSIFRYDHQVDGCWVGSLIGVKSEDTIDCGYKAPYGGPDVVRVGESTTAIIELLRHAVVAARQTGAKILRIRARPSYHSANDTSILFALFNIGFRIESCELSQGLDVTRYTCVEHYIMELKASQRNQIRRGLRQAEFRDMETLSEWNEAYGMLSLNRSFRGLALRFPYEYLMQLRSIFPHRLSMSMLRVDGRPIAAALVYRVQPKVDHIVAWGDDKTRREIAPVGTLAVHLLERAIRDNLNILDIGISSVDGVPDEGLIAFKRHTLAEPGLRLNLVQSL